MTINSTGNIMARSTLTGGLLGAMNGIKAIPQRLIDGLTNEKEAIPAGYSSQGEYLLDMTWAVAKGMKHRKK